MKIVKMFIVFFVIVSVLSLFALNMEAAERKVVKKRGQININTAGVDQLTKLPGIGKKKAERIIVYRKKHGRFRRIQEIMKVKGIGEKTFKKFAGRIRV